MQIEVTSEDIENGQPCDGWKCPVHLALWRATGQKWNVLSCYARTISPAPVVVGLPREARLFILKYDNHEHIEPFTFEFPIQEAQLDKPTATSTAH